MPKRPPGHAPIRLIVNADDFGLSESVNAAVLEAYDRGILTSCSLMVAAAALAEEFGCRRLRIPRDDWWDYRRAKGARALAQAPLAAIFALLGRRARRRLAGRGFRWADRVYGLFRTGKMTEPALVALLRG